VYCNYFVLFRRIIPVPSVGQYANQSFGRKAVIFAEYTDCLPRIPANPPHSEPVASTVTYLAKVSL
jgi:hypothetical protein